MAENNIQIETEVKQLQSFMAKIAKVVKELQSRIVIVEGKIKTDDADIIAKEKEVDDFISANTDAVKKINKEIKSILKDKNKKDNNKKEIDEAINRLDKEVLKIKEVKKKFEESE